MRVIVGVLVLLLVLGFLAGRDKSPAPSGPAAPVAASVAAPAAASPYSERLTEALAAVASFKVETLTTSVEGIGLAVGLFNEWAKLLNEGSGTVMSDETAAKRNELVRALRKTQTAALPILRDQYGPAVRKVLWEDDITARTIGAGFRTIELVGALFAANRNIKKANDTLYPMLMRLRFTRSQYRWYDGADKYTYYKLSPPADDAIVVFYGEGGFRKVALD